MTPLLFDKYGETFIGALSEASGCEVTWKLNGQYDLQLTYAVNGAQYKELQGGRIIVAQPFQNSEPDFFEIYEIDEAIDGVVTVYAQHISYRLANCLISQASIASPSELITAIEDASVGDAMLSRFTVTTDLTASGTIDVTTPVSARRLLYDSALKLYGGELDLFRFSAHYTDRVGQDRGAIIRYGYNATSYLLKRLTDESYNTIIPYYSNEGTYIEGNPLDLVTLSDRDIINDYTRRIAIDLTAHFSTTPTTAEVTAKAVELFRKDEDAELYQEAVSASLDVIDLSKTINYRDYIAAGEDIRPGDDVTLVVSREGLYSHFGYFKTKRRITGTVWNVLEEKYSGLEFSEPVKASESASLADIINASIGKGSTETAAQILSTEPKTEVVQTSSGGGATDKLAGMVPVYYVDQYNYEYLQGHIGGNGSHSGLVFDSLSNIKFNIPSEKKEVYASGDSGIWSSYSVTHIAYAVGNDDENRFEYHETLRGAQNYYFTILGTLASILCSGTGFVFDKSNSQNGEIVALCGTLRPQEKNAPNLGTGDYPWTIYGTLQTVSDSRKKTDVTAIPDKYSKLVDALEPVAFRYLTDEDESVRRLGLIAQDVQKAQADTDTEATPIVREDGEGVLSLDYTQLIPLLLYKIKEMDKEIKKLKKEESS